MNVLPDPVTQRHLEALIGPECFKYSPSGKQMASNLAGKSFYISVSCFSAAPGQRLS
jgi:hypothetical protein